MSIHDESALYEYRCSKCHKLLAKEDYDSASLQMKCGRCGTLNTLVEDSDDQVIITDSNGVVMYANAQVSEVTGYSMQEIIGQRPSLWGGQMPMQFYQDLWRDIKEKKRAVVLRVTNRKKDGTLYQAVLRISPILDVEGGVKFFVGVTTTHDLVMGNTEKYM